MATKASEKKQFIKFEDNIYYQKKSATACIACLELIRDLITKQSKILKVSPFVVETPKTKKSKNLKGVEVTPEDSKLKFIPELDHKLHTLYVSIQNIGTEEKPKRDIQLIEEIRDLNNLKKLSIAEAELDNLTLLSTKTILCFNEKALDLEKEMNQPNWENSEYFTSTVIDFLEKYIPGTFGPQAKIKIDKICFKKAPKLTNKQRKAIKKELELIKIGPKTDVKC